MPIVTDKKEIEKILAMIKTATPTTKVMSTEDTARAERECEGYLKNENRSISDMLPYSIYLIISKLPQKKQINFIKKNIKYIKEHDEDIFLYHMMAPKALSNFLSLEVIKEISNIDKEIFHKMINGNFEALTKGFTHEDYKELYLKFYDELNSLDNMKFINNLSSHDSISRNALIKALKNEENLVDRLFKCKKYENDDIDFITLILEKYTKKIDTFKTNELIAFTTYLKDSNMYTKFIKDHLEKLNLVFETISDNDLIEIVRKAEGIAQNVLITHFYESIIEKHDIKVIMNVLSPSIVIGLYNKDKEIFSNIGLKDWVKYFANQNEFNEEYKSILDKYEISNIEDLFETKFFTDKYENLNIEPLKYIENKYRENIKTNGNIESINKDTSIFSSTYFKNMKELKELLKNKKTTRNNPIYKKHFMNYILYLKKQNIIKNIDNSNEFKEIERLFYRMIMGSSIANLYKLASIEEIALFNRLNKKPFKATSFTVEQLEKYNVKVHKRLCKKVNNRMSLFNDKTHILKLMLMVGHKYAEKILEINNDTTVLEHLVGNVDVKNIKIGKEGNPVINNKIINILFNDNKCSRIKEMLQNKDSDLYKYFPRIFNEWDLIDISNESKNLNTIITYLKSEKILLSPNYYRLKGQFQYIGCSNKIVNETLLLHDQMIKRNFSTIPRVKGNLRNYSYEVLRLDDMNGLSVGNRTSCCFTILGASHSSLRHANTSSNGRVLVIKKDDKLIAHSWLWRNGDLLCLDNIETFESINEINFLDVYLKFADDIINKSFEKEKKDCIKNITIGYTNFDKNIIGIKEFPCFINEKCDLKENDLGKRLSPNRKFVNILPQPIENVEYSDAKNVQYLIRGSGVFHLGQSSYFYQDERRKVLYYSEKENYDKEYLEQMNERINALRYLKCRESNDSNNSYKNISVVNLKEAYCNDDWYKITYNNGVMEEYIHSSDEKIVSEIQRVEKQKVKIMSKTV